ncbi:MAG: VTT domain-containing protein [Proteobacteria bacterium]|nr:VTT domain-containing protein [Pseudomonadota bacterium]
MSPRPPLWLRLIPVGLVLAGALAAFLRRESLTPGAIEAGIGLLGPWMGPAFVFAHVFTSLVSVPRWAMAIVAGLLFGLIEGTAWSLAGTLAGTSAAFALARFVNSGAIVPHDLPRVGHWIAKAEAGGWRTVALARLLPVPGAAVNYGSGLTALSYRDYALGTLLGSLPAALVFANLGAAGWADPEAARVELVGAVALGLAFVALSAVLPRLLKRRS